MPCNRLRIQTSHSVSQASALSFLLASSASLSLSLFFFLKIDLFTFGRAGSSLLCVDFSLDVASWMPRLLTVVALLNAERGL